MEPTAAVVVAAAVLKGAKPILIWVAQFHREVIKLSLNERLIFELPIFFRSSIKKFYDILYLILHCR